MDQKDTKNAEEVTKDDRTLYELGYHLLPSVEENQVAVCAETLKKIIEKNSGEVKTEGAPVPTELSYTMEKVIENKHERYNLSYFGWMKFYTKEAKNIVSIKEELDGESNLLRFLLIKVPVIESTTQRTILHEERPTEKKIISAPRVKEKSAEVSDAELEKSIEKMGV